MGLKSSKPTPSKIIYDKSTITDLQIPHTITRYILSLYFQSEVSSPLHIKESYSNFLIGALEIFCQVSKIFREVLPKSIKFMIYDIRTLKYAYIYSQNRGIDLSLQYLYMNIESRNLDLLKSMKIDHLEVFSKLNKNHETESLSSIVSYNVPNILDSNGLESLNFVFIQPNDKIFKVNLNRNGNSKISLDEVKHLKLDLSIEYLDNSSEITSFSLNSFIGESKFPKLESLYLGANSTVRFKIDQRNIESITSLKIRDLHLKSCVINQDFLIDLIINNTQLRKLIINNSIILPLEEFKNSITSKLDDSESISSSQSESGGGGGGGNLIQFNKILQAIKVNSNIEEFTIDSVEHHGRFQLEYLNLVEFLTNNQKIKFLDLDIDIKYNRPTGTAIDDLNDLVNDIAGSQLKRLIIRPTKDKFREYLIRDSSEKLSLYSLIISGGDLAERDMKSLVPLFKNVEYLVLKNVNHVIFNELVIPLMKSSTLKSLMLEIKIHSLHFNWELFYEEYSKNRSLRSFGIINSDVIFDAISGVLDISHSTVVQLSFEKTNCHFDKEYINNPDIHETILEKTISNRTLRSLNIKSTLPNDFSFQEKSTFQFLRGILENSKSLENLEFSNNYCGENANDKSLDELILNHPSLKSLGLKGTGVLSPKLASAMFAHRKYPFYNPINEY